MTSYIIFMQAIYCRGSESLFFTTCVPVFKLSRNCSKFLWLTIFQQWIIYGGFWVSWHVLHVWSVSTCAE